MVPLFLGIVSNCGTCTYQCSLPNFTPISLHMLKYIIKVYYYYYYYYYSRNQATKLLPMLFPEDLHYTADLLIGEPES